jgi:hypothetical protein
MHLLTNIRVDCFADLLLVMTASQKEKVQQTAVRFKPSGAGRRLVGPAASCDCLCSSVKKFRMYFHNIAKSMNLATSPFFSGVRRFYLVLRPRSYCSVHKINGRFIGYVGKYCETLLTSLSENGSKLLVM